MLAALPLMIVPFLLYNVVMMGLVGAEGVSGLGSVITSVQMLSGADWTLSLGDILIVVSLVALFFEILKATLHNSASLLNHMLSMLVFIAFLVEFLLVRDAATQIFFILMAMSLIDVVAGFTISIRSAGRDVSIGL